MPKAAPSEEDFDDQTAGLRFDILFLADRLAQVTDSHYEAAKLLPAENRIEIVPGAGHLFEEPGKLDVVARLARAWFEEHLITSSSGNVSKRNTA